jgi:hypothetical protein
VEGRLFKNKSSKVVFQLSSISSTNEFSCYHSANIILRLGAHLPSLWGWYFLSLYIKKHWRLEFSSSSACKIHIVRNALFASKWST